MALDATIKGASADTYVTLAEFDDYSARMGFDLTSKSDAEKETGLRRSVMYLDDSFNWRGTRYSDAQARDWPRYGAYDDDGYLVDEDTIPQAVKDAQCEAAYLQLTGTDLAPANVGAVTAKTVKAGPAEVSTTYSGASAVPRFTTVERLVKSLVEGGQGTVPMVRG